MNSPRTLLSSALLLLAACGGVDDDPPPVVQTLDPVPVSILVEVYDPVTNFVWENVGVRVVEADQEWADWIYTNPFEDWYLTNAAGQVLLTEYDLAVADVGFRQDAIGRALLFPRGFEDQATVLLEVWAEGFASVFVEVDLCWCQPDVAVAIPFR